eukprot:Gb_30679 [translate_table: standard]
MAINWASELSDPDPDLTGHFENPFLHEAKADRNNEKNNISINRPCELSDTDPDLPCHFENPFLPEARADRNDESEMDRIPSHVHRESDIETEALSRYHEEYLEIKEIGHGGSSFVYKVLNKVDGCFYAMKCMHYDLSGGDGKIHSLNEVQALATVGFHENIIRYHTAWLANDRLYIQLQLCDHNLSSIKGDKRLCSEKSLLDIVYQMSKALAHIHDHGIVHMDVRPDNIYIVNGTFKLGGFRHAAQLTSTISIKELHSQYMPIGITNVEDPNYGNLENVDIFALGATVYELAKGSPLPSCGAQFDSLRQGKSIKLKGYSPSFQNLLRVMMHPRPFMRPTAKGLLGHSVFQNYEGKIVPRP